MNIKHNINFKFNTLTCSALIALIVWGKFFCVDFAIADVLNWPVFNINFLDNCHVVRHAMRAFAVSLPSLASVICIFAPFLFLSGKKRIIAFIVLDFFMTLLVCTDRLYIRYYTDIFIFQDLMLLPQTGLIANSIWSLLKIRDFVLFADFPVIFFMLKTKRKTISNENYSVSAKKIIACVISAAILVEAGTIWNIKKARPTIMNAMYDRLSVCAWISAATFHLYDFYTLVSKSLFPQYATPEVRKEAVEWFNSRNKGGKKLTKAKNLIFIQCEALQYFVIGLKINGTEVTPNLNRFMNECLYFPNVWGQTAGGNSADAEFMANTGLFPSNKGAAYTLYDKNYYNSPALAMRKHGARCFVMQGTPSSFWNCNIMHHRLHFHSQYSQNTFPYDSRLGLGLSDKVIFSRAAEIIKETKSPFYAFIVTLSSHHPFDFPEIPRDSLDLPEELKNNLIGNYLLSVNYFDKQFGMFIEKLRKDKILENCVIAIYGDHPAIPIAYKEDMEKLLGHRIGSLVEWKKTRRVPLMIYTPEFRNNPRTDVRNIGQIDILPTVSGILGLNLKTVFGKNLMEEGEDLVIFRNGTYISADTFVEPMANKATNMITGKETSCDKFKEDTKEANYRLMLNDKILETDLIRKILCSF